MGITFGRFISGFIADKLGDKKLIRIGTIICLSGILLVALPFRLSIFSLSGLIIIGFGCSPIYPSIIHSTPKNFGSENSQAIIGIQMASAYVGSTFMPPLFGLIVDKTNISIFPFYLIIFAVLMFIMTEKLNKKTKIPTV